MADLSVSGMKSRVQRGRRMLRERVLECCRVGLDSSGLVMEYEERQPAEGACGCDAAAC